MRTITWILDVCIVTILCYLFHLIIYAGKWFIDCSKTSQLKHLSSKNLEVLDLHAGSIFFYQLYSPSPHLPTPHRIWPIFITRICKEPVSPWSLKKFMKFELNWLKELHWYYRQKKRQTSLKKLKNVNSNQSYTNRLYETANMLINSNLLLWAQTCRPRVLSHSNIHLYVLQQRIMDIRVCSILWNLPHELLQLN